jgi:hypothetical protein
MRAYEFITESIKSTNTQGLSCSDWLTLLEHFETKNSLFEDLDQSDIKYLDGLNTYSVNGIVGKQYIPIFLMLFPGKVTCYGINHLATLTKIKHTDELTEYSFIDKDGQVSTWPSSRLTKFSYSKLYLFDNEQNFEEFRTAIAIKFEPIIPKAEFT